MRYVQTQRATRSIRRFQVWPQARHVARGSLLHPGADGAEREDRNQVKATEAGRTGMDGAGMCYVSLVSGKWIPPALVAGIVAFIVAVLRRRPERRVDGRWPTNFAHRGASSRAPENTLEAFRLAV